ncbi:transposase [Cardiobacterium sp. AH-315-I02]|nr:transposase [Cardiobacterium sp. AH-315-I02]
MSELRLYSVVDIVDALGIKRQNAYIRATKGRKATKTRPAEPPWQVHSTEKRRGGSVKLYLYDALPKDVQQAIDHWIEEKAFQKELAKINAQAEQAEADALARSIDVTFAQKQKEIKKNEADLRRHKQECSAKFNRLPKDDNKRKRAYARKHMLFGSFALTREQRMSQNAAWEIYCERVNNGQITLPEAVSSYIPWRYGMQTLFVGTLRNWKYKYDDHGIWGLADGHGKNKGKTKISKTPGLFRIVMGALVKFPQVTGRAIKEFLGAEHPNLNIVSERRITAFLTDWKKDNAQLWAMVSSPDKWKNVYMSAAGSHFDGIERLNQLWELDSTPGDWLLTDGRHSVVGVIDMFSRRLKFYVSKTSTAMAVCQVFRRALLDWGVPEMVRTDNGKDYVSEQFCLALNELEIKQQVCIPFASEEKGTIERAMRTMSHGILNLLPGFIGHNVGDRKVIEARKSFSERIMKKGEVVEVSMSSEQLQEILDKWTDHYYERSEHRGLEGLSPFEKALSYTGVTNVIHHMGALDMLLCEYAKKRSIVKKGIRFNRHNYFNEDFATHIGKKATLKYDEQDIGRLYAYVEGEYIGVMVCHQLLGISRQEAAIAAKVAQKKRMSELSKELKVNKQYVVENIAEVVLNHRIEQSSKITAFPAKTQIYTTPALEQAQIAAEDSTDVIQGNFPLQKKEDEVDELLGNFDTFMDAAWANRPKPLLE